MISLVGSGEYLGPMEPVDRLLLGELREPPRVVCLPTAAGAEGKERIAYWSSLGIKHFTRLGANVEALPVIDRDSADDKVLAERIANANFVYLSGGKPGYLYETLTGSLAWEAIISVSETGGILAGCSAGAMIMGEVFFGFTGWKSGFSLLSGATIIPHFDEFPRSRLNAICAQVPEDLTAIGIDGNTALIKDGDRIEVLGSGGVTICDKDRRIRYTRGRAPPLPM